VGIISRDGPQIWWGKGKKNVVVRRMYITEDGKRKGRTSYGREKGKREQLDYEHAVLSKESKRRG